MNIKEQKNIRLLNYSTSSVNLPLPKGDKVMLAANGDIPFADYFDWEEIEYIYNRSSAISCGLVEPDPEHRQEFYEALKKLDWKDSIWFHETIEDVIFNPTMQNVERVVAITNLQIIDRIRGRMLGYINAGRGLNSQLISVVNRRYEEISKGIRKSKIRIQPIEPEHPISNAELEAIKAQNEMLMKQMEEMQKKLAGQIQSGDLPKTLGEDAETSKKSPGRPKAKG